METEGAGESWESERPDCDENPTLKEGGREEGLGGNVLD